MNIDLTKEQVSALYRGGNEESRKAIKEALGEEFSNVLPIMERVKNFEDACNELGSEHPAVRAYNSVRYSFAVSENDPETADIVAFTKMRIISAALNEGWTPQFTQDEVRWYPWYELVTEEDINEMSEEDKCRVVGRAYYNAVAEGGLVCSCANVVSTYSDTFSGSRLAFKSRELAEYAGELFADIYADFCFIPKCANKAESK